MESLEPHATEHQVGEVAVGTRARRPRQHGSLVVHMSPLQRDTPNAEPSARQSQRQFGQNPRDPRSFLGTRKQFPQLQQVYADVDAESSPSYGGRGASDLGSGARLSYNAGGQDGLALNYPYSHRRGSHRNP